MPFELSADQAGRLEAAREIWESRESEEVWSRLPDGDYHAQIQDVKAGATQAGDTKVVLDYYILEGKEAQRSHKDHINLLKPKPVAHLRQNLEILGYHLPSREEIGEGWIEALSEVMKRLYEDRPTCIIRLRTFGEGDGDGGGFQGTEVIQRTGEPSEPASSGAYGTKKEAAGPSPQQSAFPVNSRVKCTFDAETGGEEELEGTVLGYEGSQVVVHFDPDTEASLIDPEALRPVKKTGPGVSNKELLEEAQNLAKLHKIEVQETLAQQIDALAEHEYGELSVDEKALLGRLGVEPKMKPQPKKRGRPRKKTVSPGDATTV